MMRDIDQLIKDDVSGYDGPHAEFVRQVPAVYRLMVHILEDPNLPGRLRPMVITAIAYFVLPSEIISEFLRGPEGYLDDIFLCAYITDRLRTDLGSDDILKDNWDGDTPVVPLIESILAQEDALIGDRRELVMWYSGLEFLDI